MPLINSPPLIDIGRETEVFLPVGDERAAGEMGAGRVAGDIDAVRRRRRNAAFW
jgi:hypothetical protein